jgi:tripartite-type tricarboxylate transporter receptor subunit TctC
MTNSLTLVLRRGFLAGALCAIALALPVAAPAREPYPNRTVRIIVPFAPGGPTDILARLVAAGLERSLGKSFIIENRPGASGNIGTGSVARAEPDGYTLLITSSALTANPALFNDLPYDPLKDLAPVAELGTSPNVFVAHPVTGIKTMEQLVAEAKKNPGVLNIAIPGLGTTPHLAAELLRLRAGLDIVNVPFAGAGPSIQAVLGGQTQTASTALPPAQPHIQSGALNGLAVTGSERWSDLPEVPTMGELGYKDFVLETVIPFLAPAGTPQEIIDILAEKAIAVLKQPEVRERARLAGFQVLANGPDELRARIEREVPNYRNLVSEAGIQKQ